MELGRLGLFISPNRGSPIGAMSVYVGRQLRNRPRSCYYILLVCCASIYSHAICWASFVWYYPFTNICFTICRHSIYCSTGFVRYTRHCVFTWRICLGGSCMGSLYILDFWIFSFRCFRCCLCVLDCFLVWYICWYCFRCLSINKIYHNRNTIIYKFITSYYKLTSASCVCSRMFNRNHY